MTIVNLTPHPLNLHASEGVVTEIPASGQVARVSTVPGTYIGEVAGVELYSQPTFGPVEVSSTDSDDVLGFPDPQEGTIYIVSGWVAGQVRRPDVFSPGTGPSDGAVRDENGRILGVTRLIRSV